MYVHLRPIPSVKSKPKPADTDFIGLDPNNGAWNVVRRLLMFHTAHTMEMILP